MIRKCNICVRKKQTKEPKCFYVMIFDEKSNLVDEKTFKTEKEKMQFLGKYKSKLIGKNNY